MPRRLSFVPTLMVLALLLAPQAARAVIVPDDYPTIQSALDAGATEIQVRDNVPPERLSVAHDARIEPAPFGNKYFQSVWVTMPLIRSISLAPTPPYNNQVQIFFRGVRVLGQINLPMNAGTLVFEACRLDSGFVGPQSLLGVTVSVRGCTLLGDCSFISPYTQLIDNTVVGAKITIRTDGVHDIRDNFVLGPSDVGLELALQESDGEVSRNSVRATGDGIRVGGSAYLLKNDIRDCSADGIVSLPSTFSSLFCDSNTVTNCGGAGITVRRGEHNDFRMVSLVGNTITGSGGGGVCLPGSMVYLAHGNLILDSHGDGVFAESAEQFEGNVIGRSGGAGYRVNNIPETMSHNTFFSNSAGGVVVADGLQGSADHNIFAFNGGPGLTNSGPDAPALSCNDWFQNVGGATVRAAPGADDAFVNPLFCDLAHGDGHLAAGSPLLAYGACGLIGAHGQGCDGTTTVEPSTGTTRVFRAWPVPASGAVSFSLPPSLAPVAVEVFDVSGARRWQTSAAAGAPTLHWNRRDERGTPVPPGVYFARLMRCGAEVARVRLVLTE